MLFVGKLIATKLGVDPLNPTPSIPWILEDGTWNDNNFWVDTENWIDDPTVRDILFDGTRNSYVSFGNVVMDGDFYIDCSARVRDQIGGNFARIFSSATCFVDIYDSDHPTDPNALVIGTDSATVVFPNVWDVIREDRNYLQIIRESGMVTVMVNGVSKGSLAVAGTLTISEFGFATDNDAIMSNLYLNHEKFFAVDDGSGTQCVDALGGPNANFVGGGFTWTTT